MDKRSLILASSSPRRQELIRLLGIPYDIIVSQVNEHISPTMTPEEAVRELSERKAAAVYEKLCGTHKDGVIIGADTVVVLNGEILGKPGDDHEAFRMLDALQGRTHDVYSGITCIDTESEKKVIGHCRTAVTIKPLSEQQINRYIQTGEPMDKAGSYAIQGIGAAIVDSIEGDYLNVVGMSLSLLSDMLTQFDIEVI